MTDRNIACKTCGTKVFKIQEEVDAHHKEAHPEVESKDTGDRESLDKDPNQSDQ